MQLRIICTETEWGIAANVGGPVHVTPKTFLVECPDSCGLGAYLKEAIGDKWRSRAITAVEIIDPPDHSPAARETLD